jgi:hypothetical protein
MLASPLFVMSQLKRGVQLAGVFIVGSVVGQSLNLNGKSPEPEASDDELGSLEGIPSFFTATHLTFSLSLPPSF